MNIVSELETLKNDPAQDIAPEATKYKHWMSEGRKAVADADERIKLDKKYRKAHFDNFYKYVAKAYPFLIFEKDNERQYFLYQERTGLYEDLSDVFIKEMVTKLYIEEGFAAEGKINEVRQCMLRFRSMFPERGIRLEDFDNQENWFHCSNGWVEVNTLEFVSHSPDRLSRFVAEVAYDRKAKAPVYEGMMQSFGLPADQVRVLHQFSGLCLTGDIKQQKMLVLLGRPGCGKSTVVEIWRKVLGQLAVVKSLTTFSNENAVRFIGGSLIGKTMIHFDEADVKRAELGAHVSNLVTGDTIDVERKSVQGNVDVKNKLKCILSANKLPPGQDGIFRRMILIRFQKSFTDDMVADRNLPEKLRGEASGILNRMLEGLADLRKMGGFTDIAGHDELIEEYKAESDIMAEFLDAFFEPTKDIGDESSGDGTGIPSAIMFATYRQWSESNGVGHILKLTPQKFGRMISNVSLTKFSKMHTYRTTAGSTWRGIKPKKGIKLNQSKSAYIIEEQLALLDNF